LETSKFSDQLSPVQAAILQAATVNPNSPPQSALDAVNLLTHIILSKHDFGDWSELAFDGLADPSHLSESNGQVRYCGEAWTLGGRLGWKMPVAFSYSYAAEGEAVTYKLSLGTDTELWMGLSDKKKWEKLYLLSRGELHEEWAWAFSVIGDVPLGHTDN
jgi:hypothetical protein